MNCAGKKVDDPKDSFFVGKYRVLVIAHRGFSGMAPENTLAAFRQAMAIGSDLIELDVHRSKDGRVVVIHDPLLARTTNGQGSVTDYTLKELQQFDAGFKFAPQFAGEKIPALKEVLALAKGKVRVNIEIKGEGADPSKRMELTDLTLDEVQRAGMLSQVLFSSFYPEVLDRVKDKNLRARVAILYHQPWTRLTEITQGRPYRILNLRSTYLTKEKIAWIHQAGLKINVYTVNAAKEMEQLARWAIDGIITNYPDRLIQVLQKR
jgi:glycerophosphoryl diester phosphodiesterase